MVLAIDGGENCEMNHTYERLLQLPLFLGMSMEEVTELVGYTRLGFHRIEAGKTVVSEHDNCRELVFLQKGTLAVSKSSDRHDYRIEETVSAPLLIEPERLFGLYQHFSRTYVAQTECHLITIGKADVVGICQQSNIFFINLLGLFSTAVQRAANQPWHDQPSLREDKIIHFLANRILSPKGAKTVNIKMQTLATAIHESRLNVSHTLNEWQAQGLVRLGRGVIDIPRFEDLGNRRNQ